ncbi:MULTISPECIES: hypothetical protein [unclassified Caballeronia]|uniref:hypothetical protein n=1 Tax=unclassified Caballeronia TaxID=2646786 RepID=UPI0028589384|nr:MULTISPECIES: hypothetical protein [unclassified Caballeronia]MDR5816452.1 hypothetical protein [Caballeronia sp. LZ033]MDR5823123.1 hypothetical protein [Caballeronia sp. LZ043]MDR5881251.1 hypothetical protein [Caballeronia sp. LZ032]
MSASSAASRHLRLWTVLSRVRDVRVQRRLGELARAQRDVQSAQTALGHAIGQCELHAAQLAGLQDWRASGPHGPEMWRHARERHRQREAVLAREADTAREGLAAALREAHAIRAALRREMHARDDARVRLREVRMKARGQD